MLKDGNYWVAKFGEYTLVQPHLGFNMWNTTRKMVLLATGCTGAFSTLLKLFEIKYPFCNLNAILWVYSIF